MIAAGLTVAILVPWFALACKVWTRLAAQDKQR